MSVTASWRRIKSGDAQLPTSIQWALVLLALDAVILVFAIADVLGFDESTAGITLLGSTYRLDEPAFPWIVGTLAALSVAAVWSGAQGRRFWFVFAVATAWLCLAVGAITQGSGAGLLVWRLLIVVLLLRGRQAFVS